MLHIKRTNSQDTDFIELVKLLDAELAYRDGKDHAFYSQFNKITMIRYTVVAYEDNQRIACGAIKEFDASSMEVKRMYVIEKQRGKGVAGQVLKELEQWTSELGCDTCVLETGKNQPEALKLYAKSGYSVIPNYGQYIGIENSVCFKKHLLPLVKS